MKKKTKKKPRKIYRFMEDRKNVLLWIDIDVFTVLKDQARRRRISFANLARHILREGAGQLRAIK